MPERTRIEGEAISNNDERGQCQVFPVIGHPRNVRTRRRFLLRLVRDSETDTTSGVKNENCWGGVSGWIVCLCFGWVQRVNDAVGELLRASWRFYCSLPPIIWTIGLG